MYLNELIINFERNEKWLFGKGELHWEVKLQFTKRLVGLA